MLLQPPQRTGRGIIVCAIAAALLTGCADSGHTGDSLGASEPTATPGVVVTSGAPPAVSPSSPSTPSVSTAQGTSGLEGTTVTDRCPVVTESGCPTIPITTHVVVTNAAGTVAAVDTAANGHFRIVLKPGEYTVQASALSAGITRPATVKVTVVAGRFASLTLMLDSGIQ